MQDFYQFISSLWVVWLAALFVGILFWVFRPSNKKKFEEQARIPLDDDEPLATRRDRQPNGETKHRNGNDNGSGPGALRTVE